MPKVYITRKKLNEDVSITDPTLAQQYLAVKKQMADKRTKRDQLMKNVNQIDNEMNILEKNLIAIEVKSAQSQGEVKATKPENREQPVAQTQTQNQGEIVSNESISYDFDDLDEEELDEDGFIGGDTQGKAQAFRTRLLKVDEEMFNTNVKLADKYEENGVYRIKGEEKVVADVEKYSNGAIITFRDGSEYSAEELDGLNAKFVRKLSIDEVDDLYGNGDDGWESEYYKKLEDEEKLQDLQDQLADLEEEEEQIRIDMEQDLADYDEISWEPDRNPRRSLSTGETESQEMPHDVYGEALQDVEDRQAEIRKQIRELLGSPQPREMTYDEAKKLREDRAEYGRMNMGPTNLNDDEDVYKVDESIYDDIINDLESEKEKMEKIQDFITDITDNIEIDINTPDEDKSNVNEPTEILEPEDEPEILMPIPVQDEPELPTFNIVQYDDDEDYDNEDPFMLSPEEKLVSQTLKAEEDKGTYVPELMEDEDIETEIEMMNYEDEDQERDEYVFHVRIPESIDNDEIIAKFYRDDEEDFWTVRVVKGDEEPLESMEFDPRLDKIEIISKLASIYNEVEIIDPKEYEYLLDDKEKIDSEYYEDLVK